MPRDDDRVRPDGTYGPPVHPMRRREDRWRAEAEQYRREHPDETTQRFSVPPAVARSWEPSGYFLFRWTKALWLVGGAVVVIVAGTLAVAGWVYGAIDARTKPLYRRLDRIEEKLDRIVERLP